MRIHTCTTQYFHAVHAVYTGSEQADIAIPIGYIASDVIRFYMPCNLKLIFHHAVTYYEYILSSMFLREHIGYAKHIKYMYAYVHAQTVGRGGGA